MLFDDLPPKGKINNVYIIKLLVWQSIFVYSILDTFLKVLKKVPTVDSPQNERTPQTEHHNELIICNMSCKKSRNVYVHLTERHRL